jgi:hypothetical protein
VPERSTVADFTLDGGSLPVDCIAEPDASLGDAGPQSTERSLFASASRSAEGLLEEPKEQRREEHERDDHPTEDLLPVHARIVRARDRNDLASSKLLKRLTNP